ncbi:MAG TPA: GDSL-type esterase/lipase family protein [Thermoanaerobaculia bacterium]|nr:GDSL-type esterase/lipase family protein [Thermoanaerobaculia bacterium]
MTPSIRAVILAAALTAPLTAYPAPREFHVAVVGDSLAQGAGDESGQGIAGRLEPELRSRGVDSVVTVNFGANGATTSDIAARLRQPATRVALARANAIVLSAGANDLRRSVTGEQPLRSPLVIVDQVLRNIAGIVAELHRINPEAHILILGAYNPVPHQRAAAVLQPLITIWDVALVVQFADDPLVSIVRLSDIVDRPERLSTLDSFHPGGEAYQETARRIAELLGYGSSIGSAAPASPLLPEPARQP